MNVRKMVAIGAVIVVLAGGIVAVRLTLPFRSHQLVAEEPVLGEFNGEFSDQFTRGGAWVSYEPNGYHDPSPGYSHYHGVGQQPQSNYQSSQVNHPYGIHPYDRPPITLPPQPPLVEPNPSRSSANMHTITVTPMDPQPETVSSMERPRAITLAVAEDNEMAHVPIPAPVGYVDMTLRAVSCLERPGDRVDILFYGKLPGHGGTTKSVLNNVLVVAVAKDNPTSISTESAKIRIAEQPTCVCTFRVKHEHVAILGLAMRMGELFLTLRKPDASEDDEPTLGTFADWHQEWEQQTDQEQDLPTESLEADADQVLISQLRKSTQQLERVANQAEAKGDFSLADRIRELAQNVRLEARNLDSMKSSEAEPATEESTPESPAPASPAPEND